MSEKRTDGFFSPSLNMIHFDHLPSTNTFVADLARHGVKEGVVVIADYQSEGRGRHGRSFYSPQGSGLYMSVLLRPQFQSDVAVRITTAAAVAVAEAIEQLTDQKAEIKWVNDIFLSGKKVGGILTEGALTLEGKGLDFAVLGIGVNIAMPQTGFPDEIKKIAGSLGVPASSSFRNRLADKILYLFFQYYTHLEDSPHFEAYRSRLCFFGKKIVVNQGNSSYDALACGLDTDFRLIVQKENGREAALSCGEISIKI